MGRRPTPQPLMLAESSAPERGADGDPTLAETSGQAVSASPADSGRSPVSKRSSPFSARFALKRPQTGTSALQSADDSPARDDARSSTPEPQPALRQHALVDAKKTAKTGFFPFNKSSKGSSHHLRDPAAASTPSAVRDGAAVPKHRDFPYAHDALQKPSTPLPSRSELSLSSFGDAEAVAASSPGKRPKPKPFGFLGQAKPPRDGKDHGSPKASPAPLPAGPSSRAASFDNPTPLRTAPVAQDWSLRDMMGSAARNRSQDRAPSRDASSVKDGNSNSHSREREQRAHPPSSLRENGGSAFLSGLRSSSTRAADILSKGLFGKSSRSSSTMEREPAVDDEHYVLKVINLPLVEQTRLTRISKRLEDSRDKTEFWMPAFPWRAIDYLNYKGCDVEGLYRVPGSGPQIKKWQRKFDEHYDVNLFEENDLYDINIIGSMLKAWLRELPDELFPKEAQDRISRECAGSTEVPQMLVDELSNLSPFNYYLLFAITCHLSLLLAHSDKNKMDFRNLCICFQPCMKIDAFCFKFLVCDWRDCWKGCKNEAKYIEEEYVHLDQPPPRGLSEAQRPAQNGKAGGRQLSSPDSTRQSDGGGGHRNGRSKRHRPQLSGSNASVRSNGSTTSSTNPSTHSERAAAERSGDLRPLSPIKPLSPIGF